MWDREIWMVNQYASTPGRSGGTRNFDLAQELSRLGYKVTVFSSRKERDRSFLIGKFDIETYGKVTFVWVSVPWYERNDWRRVWNMLAFAINVLMVAVRVPGRPITVMASSPSPLAALSGWVIARIRKARFVLEVMDLWPECLVDMGLNEWSVPVKFLRVVEHIMYAVADSIIVLAPSARRYLLKRGVPSEKVICNPNGVLARAFDVDRLAEARDGVRRKFGFTRFTVVYTGAHGPANSLDTVIEAAKLLHGRTKDVEIVLVGDGPLKRDLIKSANEAGLTNVRFMDPIPHEKVPELLLAADAGIISLLNTKTFSYAVSPNKIFEYMAAGLPVICAIPGELKELVVSKGAGIGAEPQNPLSVAEAILTVFSLSEEERKHMGERGKMLVRTCFDREKLAIELVGVLDPFRGHASTAEM